MSISEDKMDVIVTKNMPWGDDKKWVRVTLKKSRIFVPSFEDLYRIIRAICHCEEEKYPAKHRFVGIAIGIQFADCNG